MKGAIFIKVSKGLIFEVIHVLLYNYFCPSREAFQEALNEDESQGNWESFLLLSDFCFRTESTSDTLTFRKLKHLRS
jgi:hypothetical protein